METRTDPSGASEALLEDIGRHLARLDRSLAQYTHPALERPLWWKMDNALDVIDSFKTRLAEPAQRALVELFEARYRDRVVPALPQLRRGVIHNDANRGNVVVDESGQALVSIIDFGDMVESWLVVEPAIAATYAMLEQDDPLSQAASLFRGYQTEIPLAPLETELAFDFICLRLCLSICINAHQSALTPDNDYLNTDVQPARELLQRLSEIDPDDARNALFPARQPGTVPHQR